MVNLKDNVSPREENTSLSKIFKELAKLEKDYRNQETLYKIQTEDLDKAEATNRILKQHLETAYAEIEILRNNVQSWKVKYEEYELHTSQEKCIYEEVIQKLTNKISTMTTQIKSTAEKQDALWKHSKAALQEEHNKFISELQRKHTENLFDLEKELERETNNSKQLQSKLDLTMEDNLLLQDKLRKLHQEYLPLEAYKTQLKNISAANEKLKTQCLHMKAECQSLLTENTHLQKHNERLNQIVSKYNDQQSKFEAEKSERQVLMVNAQTQLNQVQAENTKLIRELDGYKRDYCNVETHRNIAEQNKILQELVKEMRRERLKCNGDQLQSNLDETEERIKRLEELIHELKKCAVSTKKHCIRRKLNNGSFESPTIPALRQKTN